MWMCGACICFNSYVFKYCVLFFKGGIAGAPEPFDADVRDELDALPSHTFALVPPDAAARVSFNTLMRHFKP